ncbi:hypothetical protein PIROE2DRAFT_15999, partial [Piromyces sp. E2]
EELQEKEKEKDLEEYKKEFDEFISTNYNVIDYNERLYDTAFHCKNEDAILLLSKGNWMKNQDEGIPYSPYRCTKHLKNILKNGYSFEFTSNFIISLLKYERKDYIKYIFDIYIFNNKFVTDLLLFIKNNNDPSLAKEYIEKKVDMERSKITVNMNKLLYMLLEENKDRNSYNRIENLIINYTKLNVLNLDINEIGIFSWFPLSNCNCLNLVKFILEYAYKKNVIININEQNDNDEEFFFNSICNLDNTEMCKLIMEYADNSHHIILEINKSNRKDNYPFFCATRNNNIEMCRLIMEYADDHNIVLEIKNGHNPFSLATSHNNTEMCRLIMQYANNHNIIL